MVSGVPGMGRNARFQKGVAFDRNGSKTTGGAFSVAYHSSLTFGKTNAVRTSDNFIIGGSEVQYSSTAVTNTRLSSYPR